MNNIMYEYKLDISEENKELYKSVYKRTTIFRLAILVLINCIILGTLLFLYFSLILKRYLKVFMIVILISILKHCKTYLFHRQLFCLSYQQFHLYPLELQTFALYLPTKVLQTTDIFHQMCSP